MPELRLHGQQVNTVFDLLGNEENDITYSLGWALAQSSCLCKRILAAALPGRKCGPVTAIRLQEFGPDRGYTDIEIETEQADIVVEAKVGWKLPSMGQLERYLPRLRRGRRASAIVVIAECTPDFARSQLRGTVKGVPVRYLSYEQIVGFAERCERGAPRREKLMLVELCQYLRGVMNMQKQESNRVFVLPLRLAREEWSTLTWIEFVTKKKRYFHPYGRKGWPTEAPNYLGFRYGGRLQSIHHVEGYTVSENLSKQIREIDGPAWRAKYGQSPMLVYRLGPPIKPGRVVRTGNIYPSGHVWAALDLLLTCKTISEARDRTKQRFEKVK